MSVQLSFKLCLKCHHRLLGGFYGPSSWSFLQILSQHNWVPAWSLPLITVTSSPAPARGQLAVRPGRCLCGVLGSDTPSIVFINCKTWAIIKIKMFAKGWVVYPTPRGSPEPTWHSALRASCQVGSGDPLVLGYTTQPSANILIFK